MEDLETDIDVNFRLRPLHMKQEKKITGVFLQYNNEMVNIRDLPKEEYEHFLEMMHILRLGYNGITTPNYHQKIDDEILSGTIKASPSNIVSVTDVKKEEKTHHILTIKYGIGDYETHKTSTKGKISIDNPFLADILGALDKYKQDGFNHPMLCVDVLHKNLSMCYIDKHEHDLLYLLLTYNYTDDDILDTFLKEYNYDGDREKYYDYLSEFDELLIDDLDEARLYYIGYKLK